MSKTIFLLLLHPFLIEAALLTISGNPPPLLISKATAGEEPKSVLDMSTTYSIHVPAHTKLHITAGLDSPMPPYTTLKMQMTPLKPLIALQVSAQTVTNSFKEGLHENIRITYEYSGAAAAGTIPSSAKTIILTVVESQD